jgi:hypothetical protein
MQLIHPKPLMDPATPLILLRVVLKLLLPGNDDQS